MPQNFLEIENVTFAASEKNKTFKVAEEIIEKINEFLKTHQEKREKAKQQIEQFLLENK